MPGYTRFRAGDGDDRVRRRTREQVQRGGPAAREGVDEQEGEVQRRPARERRSRRRLALPPSLSLAHGRHHDRTLAGDPRQQAYGEPPHVGDGRAVWITRRRRPKRKAADRDRRPAWRVGLAGDDRREGLHRDLGRGVRGDPDGRVDERSTYGVSMATSSRRRRRGFRSRRRNRRGVTRWPPDHHADPVWPAARLVSHATWRVRPADAVTRTGWRTSPGARSTEDGCTAADGDPPCRRPVSPGCPQ